jgi:hypothetical protein
MRGAGGLDCPFLIFLSTSYCSVAPETLQILPTLPFVLYCELVKLGFYYFYPRVLSYVKVLKMF